MSENKQVKNCGNCSYIERRMPCHNHMKDINGELMCWQSKPTPQPEQKIAVVCPAKKLCGKEINPFECNYLMETIYPNSCNGIILATPVEPMLAKEEVIKITKEQITKIMVICDRHEHISWREIVDNINKAFDKGV